MTYVRADKKYRIKLGEEILNRYGRDFLIIPEENRIRLVPIKNLKTTTK